jgi:hypothetical protein
MVLTCSEAKDALAHVVKNVFKLPDDNPLSKALAKDGITDICDILTSERAHYRGDHFNVITTHFNVTLFTFFPAVFKNFCEVLHIFVFYSIDMYTVPHIFLTFPHIYCSFQ